MTNEESNRFKAEFEKIWSNDYFSDEQKNLAISVLTNKFNKSAFINIVEEPEQNLFPNSQWELLKKLLEYNNLTEANKLIMTTHSPYIVNYISLAIQADYLKRKTLNNDLKEKLNEIIPLSSTIKADKVNIYQLNEKDGSLKSLERYEGIPSDANFLNDYLNQGNVIFDKLLEIEEQL